MPVYTGQNGQKNTLIGSSAKDYLYGGDLEDVLDGSVGADEMAGMDGNDVYVVDSYGDKIIETYTGGRDTVLTTLGVYTLSAHLENLTYMGSGNFAGTGNANANVLIGNIGQDTLDGGDGWDMLYGGTNNDILKGGAYYDELFGGSGNDQLFGGEDSYSDHLDGGQGADSMKGGGGNDGYEVDDYGDLVIEYASGGDSDLVNTTLALYTLPSNVERLYFKEADTSYVKGYGNNLDNWIQAGNGGATLEGAGGNDALIGGGSEDTFWGGEGDDTLISGSGNDALTGQSGRDIMDAGAGDDYIAAEADGDKIIGGSGVDTVDYLSSSNIKQGIIVGPDGSVKCGLNVDTLVDIENILGTKYNDFLFGFGNKVANTLVGWHGDDTFQGRGGADHFDGGSDFDTVLYDESDAGIWVNLNTGKASGGHAESNTLVSIENIVGSHFADMLFGNGVSNHLVGNGGADQIYGGGGNDLIDGGAGVDILDGGYGFDTVDYRSASAAVTVNLGNQASNKGAAKLDTLSSFEAVQGSHYSDRLIGNAGKNHLIGNDGHDKLVGGGGGDALWGGKGIDHIEGGAGVDDLWGGQGYDTFVFRRPLEGGDVIHDFNTAQDTIAIQLGNYLWDLKPFIFEDLFAANATGSATAWQAQVIYNTSTGTLWFDGNGKGAGGKTLIASFDTLIGVKPQLTSSDILFI